MQVLELNDTTQLVNLTVDNDFPVLLSGDAKIQRIISAIRVLHALTPILKVEFNHDLPSPGLHRLVVTLVDGRTATYTFLVVDVEDPRYTLTIGGGGPIYWRSSEATSLIDIRRAVADCHATHHILTFEWERVP